jgi:hypothetical protein
MAHPLDGAYKRICRTNVHIEELKTVIERFRKLNENKLFPKYQATAAQWHQLNVGQRTGTIAPDPSLNVPEDIPILVGEIIYNLRAALDYLVYELAINDTPGREPERTQFIIESHKVHPKNKKCGFDASAKKHLSGLSGEHIRSIELFQPYKGCAWTKTLAGISNPDKHRHLTVIGGIGQARSFVEVGISGQFDNLPGKILRGRGADYTDTHIDFQYTIEITFPDGSPLLKTLYNLKFSVTDAVKSFEPEFKK